MHPAALKSHNPTEEVPSRPLDILTSNYSMIRGRLEVNHFGETQLKPFQANRRDGAQGLLTYQSGLKPILSNQIGKATCFYTLFF